MLLFTLIKGLRIIHVYIILLPWLLRQREATFSMLT